MCTGDIKMEPVHLKYIIAVVIKSAEFSVMALVSCLLLIFREDMTI